MCKKISYLVAIAFVLCAFQFSSASTASSTSSSFTIEDYVPQDFSDLLWTVGGRASGSASKDRNDNTIDLEPRDYRKSSSISYNLSLDSRLTYIKETLEDYMRSTLSVRTNFRSVTSESSRITEDGFPIERIDKYQTDRSLKDIGFLMYPYFEYKKFTEQNYFYGFHFRGRFRYDRSLKNKSSGEDLRYALINDYHTFNNYSFSNDNETEREFYDVEFDLSIGDGRLYVGKYAFIAYNIIQGLQKDGLLITQPDKKMMIALTKIIYQYENSHTIDKRLKTIDKFDAIYSYLLENKIVKKSKHKGMLLVQDAYQIFPKDYRRFGFSKSIGIGMSYDYYSSELSEDRHSNRLLYQYHVDSINTVDTTISDNSFSQNYRKSSVERLSKFVVASIEYSKPINMQWQIDTKADAKFYFDSYEDYVNLYIYHYNNIYDTSETHRFNAIQKDYNINIAVQTAYFYNSRTAWRNSLEYNFARYKLEYGETFNGTNHLPTREIDRETWRIEMSSSLEYRLSIPTTLRGSISYSDQDSNSYESTRFNFSLSLLHYIY